MWQTSFATGSSLIPPILAVLFAKGKCFLAIAQFIARPRPKKHGYFPSR